MNVLFVHQNMPGQFGHLAAALARNPANRVVFLTKADRTPPAGVARVLYRPARAAHAATHHYIRGFETAVLHGQAVAGACLAMRERNFVPDVVVAHPGWGESLYVKDVFPSAKLLSYCEFFYHAAGADVGFDPAEAVDAEVAARLRTKNAPLLLALAACDRGLCPTRWQQSLQPAEYRDKIEVIFDGIDAERARPAADASFALPDGTRLTRRDRIVTYVARNLEPHRGFPSFMRAIPRILHALPDAHVLIAGRDGVSYGQGPADGRTWRAVMVEEVACDPARVHFLGPLPYDNYLRLLQISAAHVYLTVPFVLSWSALEALAAGCVVIGSRTPPVEEIIGDGDNGFLVDFFSPEEIAERTVAAVRSGDKLDGLRRRARASVIGRYDLATCLPRQLRLLNEMAGKTTPRPIAAGRAAISPMAAQA